VQPRTDPRCAAKAGDGEAGALHPSQGSETAVRIGGADPIAKFGEGGDAAQAASSATVASASCSSRINARHSPRAR
jgi:hypothetical protein